MRAKFRGVRLFVSSTFEDFKEERRLLHEQVFPQVSNVCARNGIPFEVIDLRWGVNIDAWRQHRTMSICLGEVRRCRAESLSPNFLLLLGNRYGWRPLPGEI